MKPGNIRALVVDDDRSWQQILSEILADCGLDVDVADGIDKALPLIQVEHRIAIIDLSLDGRDHRNQDGLRVLEALRSRDPGCVSILLTGYATVELAVSTIRDYGAFNCLRKEVFNRSEFRKLVHLALASGDAASLSAQPAYEPVAAVSAAEEKKDAKNETRQLLVVEDDAGWRGILEELLGDQGYMVRSCGSFGEALGCLRRDKFNLAVMDLSLSHELESIRGGERNLQRLEGYRLLASIQAGGTPVIVLSGLSDPAAIEKTFSEQRIFAYLEKQSFDRKVFLQTVREGLATGLPQGELEGLTDREREVLNLLAQGMTNKEIADKLVITTNTVKRHLKAIFTKLDIHTRSAAVAKVSGKG
jgi:DNA-binding NarL/FixJ family response regulator